MKKASMQLGINAIVILIIALAVLGLAMSFITGLFRQSGAKYSAIIDRTDLDFHADSVTPVMFETNEVTVKAGREMKLKVSVYNTKFSDSDEINLELIKCINSDGSEAWPERNPIVYYGTTYHCADTAYAPILSILASPQKIPVARDAGYMVLVSAKNADSSHVGTYICTVQAGEWRKDIINFGAVAQRGDYYCVDPAETTITQQLVINVEQ